jgi:hypothetical protein
VRRVGDGALRLLDTAECRRVVERRERGELVDRPLDLVVHDHRVTEARAAVYDSMADRVDPGRDRVERVAFGAFVAGPDDRELEARGAGVDDEDVQ